MITGKDVVFMIALAVVTTGLCLGLTLRHGYVWVTIPMGMTALLSIAGAWHVFRTRISQISSQRKNQ